VAGSRSRRFAKQVFENPTDTFQRKYQSPREVIYYAEHPAGISLLVENQLGWALAVVLIVASVMTTNVLIAGVALLVVLKLCSDALQAYYTRYFITSLRVLKMRGVLTRQLDWMPLGRITDIRFKQNPLERWFKFGDVQIVSASAETELKSLENVADPIEFHRLLTCAVEGKNGHVMLTMRNGRLELFDPDFDAIVDLTTAVTDILSPDAT
jgi:membrane protein YdbS with pleckstrin-like domain